VEASFEEGDVRGRNQFGLLQWSSREVIKTLELRQWGRGLSRNLMAQVRTGEQAMTHKGNMIVSLKKFFLAALGSNPSVCEASDLALSCIPSPKLLSSFSTWKSYKI
jgi:hypothetical protein